MSYALTKAIEESRSLYNTAYSQGLSLKGNLGGSLDMGPAGGFGQLDNFREQSANRRRYDLFRGWVHAAVNALAKKGASQPVLLGRLGGKGKGEPGGKKQLYLRSMTDIVRSKAADEEIEVIFEHDFLNALEHPNSIQGRWQFVYSFITNLCLTGWAFVVADKVKDAGYQFYSLPTTWVKPIHDKGPYSQFRIVNPREPASEHEGELLDRSQVAFAYIPNPGDLFSALAPAAAQSTAIKIDENIQNSQLMFFNNGIFPSVIITMGTNPHPDAAMGQYRPFLTNRQRRQVQGAITNSWGGVVNNGKPAIIDGMIEKIERWSASSNEMGWEKSEKVIRSRILSTFGVHPFVLGEEVAGSYAQSYNVKEIFYENVNSFLDMLGSCMTHFAGVLTGEEDFLVWWEAAKAKDPSQDLQMWQNARNRDDISQNEFRAYMDLPPDEDKNENLIGKNAQNVIKVMEDVAAETISPEQGRAALEGMGLPADLAKKIAGKAMPKKEPPPGMMPPGQPGQPVPPGQEQPVAGGKQPPPPKDKDEELVDKVEKALETLQRPIVIKTESIADNVSQVLGEV